VPLDGALLELAELVGEAFVALDCGVVAVSSFFDWVAHPPASTSASGMQIFSMRVSMYISLL
jgi:hypothetical protein